MTPTRGERNCNPGNIRKSAANWLGKIVGTDPDFETFDKPENGIRAIAVILLTYSKKYAVRSVRGFIRRWAPSNENDTEAYVSSVAKRMGIDDKEVLDLSNRHTMQQIVTAIIFHENGRCIYPDQQIIAGITLAYA